ncbi:MAG TPA: sensor histidine kinase [Verrucomicrobiae bacterium]|nr:sensor histidine kinase [Verrucomicrobiae bacterium]
MPQTVGSGWVRHGGPSEVFVRGGFPAQLSLSVRAWDEDTGGYQMPLPFPLARLIRNVLALGCFLASAVVSQAAVLWSDPPPRVVHETGSGSDILGGKLSRDDTASDALYFKFHVAPLSDVATEPYLAGFAFFKGTNQTLAIGNAWEAWGYSAFGTSETGPSNRVAGEFNLKSSRPEASRLGKFYPYELPRHDRERTIVFKVQYVPGGDDLVTVWLSPNLSRGASDHNQPEDLTTHFRADASFDQIRLLHGGNGNGWIFSDMAAATSFNDFVLVRFWETLWFKGGLILALLGGVAAATRVVEKRRLHHQLQLAEQERALERERSRIARDLHDELGSALTQISMMSDLMKRNIDDPAQTSARATKISQTCTETVRALEEIVWALRPGSDTIQSLTDYICHFAKELFEDDHVRCRLDVPVDPPKTPLPPEMRHNLFLIMKEALTNACKHARASEILVQARASENRLELTVADNGTGGLPEGNEDATRNGLTNMRRRAEAVGGDLRIESEPGKGTRIRVSVELPSPLQPRTPSNPSFRAP